VYGRKVNTLDELLARIMDSIARIKKHYDAEHAIFSQELKNALTLMMIFLKNYFKFKKSVTLTMNYYKIYIVSLS